MSRPLKQRPTYIGLISASEFFATAVASLLGGALTSNLSWRWCFYINILVSAAPAAILLFFLKLPTQVATRHISQREKLRELDSLGFTSFAPAVLCLLLALQWGGSAYAWSNERIVALFILSPILFGMFCFIQSRKQEKAMLVPYIIMKGTIAVASIYSLSLSASRAIAEYYTVRDASPLQSGVNTLPLVISVLIFAVLSGLITSYTGSYKLIMVPASLCVVTGVALMTTLAVESNE
ncbi:uncharacterized protein EAE97_002528 [Botrytis byssoidea]|uniref:Major facilitator superfamily (MFS) profile domain-containing protein n=1 Tax=Botrytis byssoidea TaxID=139641 RepID=A0A9P5M7L1_9HELO|nr:uncharacterized protein EAE97_002528 [Botrytis byssoidea]KAF7950976.1 hypothetical protein EAE97_002528 [Botrytis byssoidea]